MDLHGQKDKYLSAQAKNDFAHINRIIYIKVYFVIIRFDSPM